MLNMTSTMEMSLKIGFYGIAAIMMIVGTWFLLEKMGEKGWKSFIPVYRGYLIFKHVWNTEAFAANIITGILTGIALETAHIGVKTFSPAFIAVLSIVGLGFLIASLVIQIKLFSRLAKAFGHGKGYTFGLVVFEPLFILMLGLDRNEGFAQA